MRKQREEKGWRKSGGSPGRAIFVVGSAVWLAAPLAIVVLLSAQARTIELSAAVPVWVPVEQNSGQVAEPIDVVLDWEAMPPIVAPAWTGVVQDVGVTAGAPVASGDTMAVIDGIARIAHASAQPFYRTLAIGDSGPDVATLNTLLAERGLGPGTGDEYTWATHAGVRELAASLGVRDARYVQSFDPSWIVYLPAQTVEVSSVELIVGAPAPGAGATVAELDDRLGSAYLADPGDQSPEETSGESAPPRPPVTAIPGQSLTVAGIAIELAEDLERVSAAAIPVLRGLVADDVDSVSGKLSRPGGSGEWVVPAAAVFAGTGGRTCVVSGSRADPAEIEVAVLGGELGRSIVTGDLSAGAMVLVRPDAGLRRCA